MVIPSSRIFLVALAVAGLLWFFSSLAGALLPFILGVVLSYITAPLAQRMEDKGASPTLSASLIVGLLLLLLVSLPVALLPVIISQIEQINSLLPKVAEWVQGQLGDEVLEPLSFPEISSLGAENLQQAAGLLAGFVGDGLSATGRFLVVLLITPLAVFYLLRDRKNIGGELTDMLPPRMRDRVLDIGYELDNVLGEFMHGQLMVMVIMAVFYSIVLTLADLNFALTIGIISGLLVFIPYVGFITGLSLALLVGLGDFDWIQFFLIVILMSIGTVIESFAVTPRLVGERVGLHPLAVLLALVVMGEWFGFVGVLVALPVASVLLVLLRHLRHGYIGSNFYRHRE